MHTPLERSLETSPDAAAASTLWVVLRAVMFRFAFVYWLLIVLVVASNEDTGLIWIGKLVRPVWNPIVVWVGHSVLGITSELDTAINGSGDKTADWVGVFVSAATAAMATLVWSVGEQRVARHAPLRGLLRVVLRYTVAFALLGYGISKLFALQFPAPNPQRLLQQYGDSSPMGLLWTFMGASRSYEIFAGAMETLGAVLLLFRRTTALGALILVPVLTNVTLMNFCFDVPVKINAAHYLGMCIFLLLPEVHRLANLLVFNRATQPTAPDPIWPDRRVRVAGRILKYGAILFMVFQDVQGCLRWLAWRDATTWYGGYWNVTTFSRDGQDVPAIITDATRWKRIRIQGAQDRVAVRWRFMDDSYGDLYATVIDENQQVMTLTPSNLDKSKPSTGPITFRYVRKDPEHLTLEGKVGQETLSMQIERFDAGKMLLVSRGFHWINETPFNR